MDTPTASMRGLVQRLLAAEAASRSATHPNVQEAMNVCEKLRISLTRFAGADGFTSLLRRSLALARRDVASLQSVKINPDGTIEGLVELADVSETDGTLAAVALTANLIELLITFIGKPLTMRLVQETWPDTVLEE